MVRSPRCLLLLCVLAVAVLSFGPDRASASTDDSSCYTETNAIAFLYSDNSQVGSAPSNATWNPSSGEACTAMAQEFAIYMSSLACGSHGAGEAYATVQWRVWWYGEEVGGPVNQQYDCGDV